MPYFFMRCQTVTRLTPKRVAAWDWLPPAWRRALTRAVFSSASGTAADFWRRFPGEFRGAQFRGQVPGGDEAVFGHHKGVFQGALEFPDIAGPGVVQEDLHGFPGEAGDLLAAAPAQAFREMLHQQRDVLQALPERGQVDGNDVDAEKQVFPEVPC